MVAATVVVTVVLSAIALSQSPQSSAPADSTASATTGGVIKACAKKRGGALRIAKSCRRSERKVTWSQAGVEGPAGPSGPKGAPGDDGANGLPGTDGADGADGTNGVDGTTTGQTFYAETLGSQTNLGGSGTSCTTTPAGPSITFTAPAGAYVQIMAEAEIQKIGGNLGFVYMKVDGDAAFNVMSTASLAFERRFLDKGTAAGATDKYTIDPFVFPVSAGSHTISLQYGSDGGQSSFRNRKLWATMFRPTP